MPSVSRLLTVAAALALVACAHRQPRVPYDRAGGVETFEAAWRIVHESYFDTAFGGVDWVALRDSLRPGAEHARNLTELRGVVETMLDRLGRSHLMLIPRELGDSADRTGDVLRGSVGMDVRLLEERMMVTRVDSGGPAARAGVRPGWILVTVGRDRVAEIVRRARARPSIYRIETEAWGGVAGRLLAPPDSTVEVGLLDGAGRRTRLRLVSVVAPGEPVRLGGLPTVFLRFEKERTAGPGGVSVGVLRFNAWMAPIMRQLDAAVDSFRTTDGIVLDLRGNTGGLGAMISGVAGHFLERRDTLGLMRTRHTTLAIAANPRLVDAGARPVRPFAGPVAVLVDEVSASASEAFAGGMRALGRVRVFGNRSMGAVLGARWDRLPNGDQLYHAVMAFDIRGTSLEGTGVIPDEPVAVTREDLLAGGDPVLEAAIRWIATQRRGVR